MLFVLLNLVILFIIFLLLLLLSGVWPPDSPWAPWWQMPPATIREMLRLAKVNKNSVVCELGSGTGRGVIICAKEFHAKVVGIEIDPLRYWISRWNVMWSGVSKNITLQRKNFFHVSLTDATVLLLYLTPNALKRLAPKLVKELRPRTIVLSYKYDMPITLFKGKLQVIKHDAEKEFFVYKIK